MAEAEDSAQPPPSERLVLCSRARAPPQPAPPEPTPDLSNRDVWMEPAEAAEWVHTASGNVLSLEDAARELARAGSDGRLTSLQWFRHVGADVRTDPCRYLRAHVLELWPPGHVLTA